MILSLISMNFPLMLTCVRMHTSQHKHEHNPPHTQPKITPKHTHTHTHTHTHRQRERERERDMTKYLSLPRYAPSKKWHVDTILRVMTIAGDFVSDEVISNLIAVITQTPEVFQSQCFLSSGFLFPFYVQMQNLVCLLNCRSQLQSYAVQKMYIALNKDIMKQPLVQLGAWCIGEFGLLLSTVVVYRYMGYR